MATRQTRSTRGARANPIASTTQAVRRSTRSASAVTINSTRGRGTTISSRGRGTTNSSRGRGTTNSSRGRGALTTTSRGSTARGRGSTSSVGLVVTEEQDSPANIFEPDQTREDLLSLIREEFQTLTQSLIPPIQSPPNPLIPAPSTLGVSPPG